MDLQRRKFMGTHINDLSLPETVNAVAWMIAENRKGYIVEINTDVMIRIERDHCLGKINDEAALSLLDGQPLVWIARLYRRPVKEKVSGSDLTLALLRQAAERGHTVFLLGGREGVAEKAKAKAETKYPGLQVVGTCAPPFGFEKDEGELAKLRERVSAAHPDIVVACFGCPKQEKWIYENFRDIDAKVFLCAGATIDFLADNVRRAPAWMSRVGLEWFYRFLKEPRRLFKRYFVDDMKIVGLFFKYWKKA